MIASQLMLEEGQGESAGLGKGKMSYRPTKESELKLLGEKGNVSLSYRASKVADLEKLEDELAGLDIGDVSPKKKDAVISKLFSSSSKSKKPDSGESASKLLVKKKSVLEPIKLDIGTSATTSSSANKSKSSSLASAVAAASIIGKSKAGTKESLSKLSKLSVSSAPPGPGSSKADE